MTGEKIDLDPIARNAVYRADVEESSFVRNVSALDHRPYISPSSDALERSGWMVEQNAMSDLVDKLELR